jgi:hypothetical protein
MGTNAIMTVPKSGDLGSCHCKASSVIAKQALSLRSKLRHCEARRAEAISRPATLALQRLAKRTLPFINLQRFTESVQAWQW